MSRAHTYEPLSRAGQAVKEQLVLGGMDVAQAHTLVTLNHRRVWWIDRSLRGLDVNNPANEAQVARVADELRKGVG